jgi:hypothetical protein
MIFKTVRKERNKYSNGKTFSLKIYDQTTFFLSTKAIGAYSMQ